MLLLTTALLKIFQQILMAGKEYAVSMKTLISLAKGTIKSENAREIQTCVRPIIAINRLLLCLSAKFP